MAGWRVEVTGFRETMNALQAADKAAYNVIVKRITAGGKQVASFASYASPGDNPVSGWGAWTIKGRDLSFDPGSVASGYKLRRNNFRSKGVARGIGWDVVQSNAAGSVWSVMGSGKRVTTSSGASLVATVNSRFPGRSPRALIPAYYSVMSEEFQASIRDQIYAECKRLGMD